MDLETRFIEDLKEKGFVLKDLKRFSKVFDFLEANNTKFNIEQNFEIGKYLLLKGYSEDLVFAGFLCGGLSDEKIIWNFGEKVVSILKGQEIFEGIMKKSENNPPREMILSLINNLDSVLLELVLKLVEVNFYHNKNSAKESFDFYLPLADRLGFDSLKKDLANCAFALLYPKKYEEIQNYLKMSEKEREAYVEKIIGEIESRLEGKIKNFEVKGRNKQVYSIYEKIVKRGVPLDRHRDHFAIRVIVNSVENCYKVFEVLSLNYSVFEKTIKDYIKNPKPNGYKSFHFCVEFEKKIIEIQVRTKEMDEFAEEGSVSHWAYKGLQGNLKSEKKTGWLKEVMKIGNKEVSLEGIKLNLFKDKIFCYTPKGRVVDLPKDSRVLDFAYRIHAEVGNSAVGALVNKNFVSLKEVLNGGETVEIVTNKFQRPRREWLKFVKTKNARRIITKELKRIEKIPVPKIKFFEKTTTEETCVPVEIPDFPNHVASFAKCCNPLPGDEIIGVLKSFKRALIHTKNCDRIKEGKSSQVKANWIELLNRPVSLVLMTTDRPGILADILNTFLRMGFKIREANAKFLGEGFAECSFVVYAETKERIEELISGAKKIRGVNKIWIE